jgi:hypothetical protein
VLAAVALDAIAIRLNCNLNRDILAAKDGIAESLLRTGQQDVIACGD